jgi:high-affinity Fe2+/Pb2+ permease
VIGLWLSVLWLVVLFVGGAVASKTKSELYKGVTIGALVAIPLTYIFVWFVG